MPKLQIVDERYSGQRVHPQAVAINALLLQPGCGLWVMKLNEALEPTWVCVSSQCTTTKGPIYGELLMDKEVTVEIRIKDREVEEDPCT